MSPQPLQDVEMPAEGRIFTRYSTPGNIVISGPLEHGNVPAQGRKGTYHRVAIITLVPHPLEQFQVPIEGCTKGRPFVHVTSVRTRPFYESQRPTFRDAKAFVACWNNARGPIGADDRGHFTADEREHVEVDGREVAHNLLAPEFRQQRQLRRHSRFCAPEMSEQDPLCLPDVRPGSTAQLRLFATDEGRFCLARGDEDRWYISRSYLAPPGPYLHMKQDARGKFLDEVRQRLCGRDLRWLLKWEEEDECYVFETFSFFCGLPGRIVLRDYYTD